MSDRVLDITSAGAMRGIPGLRRIAWERREAGEGYHARPGEWPLTQVTVQVTLAGVGLCWPHGKGRRGPAVPVPLGAALVYDNRAHRALEYGQAPDEPWEFLYVNLLGSASSAIIADLAAVHHHAVPIAPGHPEIVALLNLVPRSGHRHATWTWQRAAQIAQRLLLALSPREPQAGDQVSADDRLVAEAMRRWRDDLARALPVGELARILGISREHLTRVFAARAGEAPARWLRRQRIAAAAGHLRGERPVAFIAKACGFADPAHFAAVFRAHTGLAPAAFRRRGGLPGW